MGQRSGDKFDPVPGRIKEYLPDAMIVKSLKMLPEYNRFPEVQSFFPLE